MINDPSHKYIWSKRCEINAVETREQSADLHGLKVSKHDLRVQDVFANDFSMAGNVEDSFLGLTKLKGKL